MQVIDAHSLAIELIHKLHAEDHGSSFQKIVQSFRNGDYNGRIDVQSFPHIEYVRRELMKMSHSRFQCSTCLQERLRRKHASKKPNQGEYTEDPFKKGSVDFYGPIQIPGIGGVTYALFYITQRGRIGFVEFVKGKNEEEIISAVQGWRLQASEAGWSLDQLHFDADSNFLSASFVDALTRLGIGSSHSAGGQHWRSGLVENFIGIIVGPSRSMLKASGLPAKFWPHAINYAVLLYNIRRNKHLDNDPRFSHMSPIEAFQSFKWHLPTPAFGQLCYSSAPDGANIGTSRFFQSSGRRCAFLGYETRDWLHPVGILFNLESGRILRSNDYTLFRNRYGYNLKEIHGSSFGNLASLQPDEAVEDNIDELLPDLPVHMLHVNGIPTRNNILTPDKVNFDVKIHINDLFLNHVTPLKCPVPTFSSYNTDIVVMNSRLSNKYFESPYLRPTTLEEFNILVDLRPDDEKSKEESLFHVHSAKMQVKVVAGKTVHIPRSYRDTQNPRFRDVVVGGMTWKSATDIEIANINQPNILGPPILSLPDGGTVVGSRLVFDAKVKKDGELDKLKCRWVILGYTEEYMVHYQETFCPTPSRESFRLLVYYAAALGWHKYLFDVKFAFLNADIDSDNLYIELPSYFPGFNPNLRQFLKLLKAIYGTKQAARLWHKLITKHLRSLGYVAESGDPCSFNLFDDTGLLVAKLVVHVDDMPCVARDPREFVRISSFLTNVAKLQLTESSSWDKVLGLLLGEDVDGNTVIYNDVIVDSLLVTLGLEDIKERDVPHLPNVYHVPNIDNIASTELHNRYRIIIGSCLWMALQWRFDIAFIVGHLSRFVSNPSIEHWEAAIHMLGYLKKHKRWGTVFFKPPDGQYVEHDPQLLMHYDANWSGDKDCRSISAYVMSCHGLTQR